MNPDMEAIAKETPFAIIVARGDAPSAADCYRDLAEEVERTAKMEAELRSYGRAVPGGYMMTAGDLLRYFRDKRNRA